MKKLLSIVVIATAFILTGCAKKNQVADDASFAQQKECKSKKCKHRHHHGKLGVEKTTEDTVK